MEALLKLSATKQRKAAAVMGALVGDAATRPLHWLYDLGKMAEVTAGKEDFAFMPENHCPFYELPTGASSNYGDSAKPWLASLAAKKQVDMDDWLARLAATFGGDDNPYQITKKERDAHPDFYKTDEWRPSGPWLSHCYEHFVKEYAKDPKAAKLGMEGGKDTDGFNATVALNAFLAPEVEDDGKTPEFDAATVRPAMEHLMLDEAGLQRNLFMAELLFRAITAKDKLDVGAAVKVMRDNLEAKGDDVSKMVVGEVDAVLAEAGNADHNAVVQKFGPACPTPGSMQNCLHTVLVFGGDYKKAVLAEMGAGGDNCGRVVMSSAIAGALGGLEAIPADWIGKADCSAEALEQCAAAFS